MVEDQPTRPAGPEKKSDRPLVVTGPTGWIGTALLGVLSRVGSGWADRMRLFGSSEREIRAPDGTVITMRDLATIAPADVNGADIVHLAYLTKEKVEVLGETAFFTINQAIDSALLGACEGARPHALFVASSGAAALAEQGEDRHLYGVAKLLQEDRFLGWGRSAGVPVVAGRIFNIAGPHINKLQSYAISSFLYQALTTGRIEISARIPVYRAYLHVEDLARLVLTALDRAIDTARPIDFCGSEIVEMEQIAHAAARIAGLADDAIGRGPIDFLHPSAYLGDPVPMRTLALRCGLELANFATQVKDTASFIRG